MGLLKPLFSRPVIAPDGSRGDLVLPAAGAPAPYAARPGGTPAEQNALKNKRRGIVREAQARLVAKRAAADPAVNAARLLAVLRQHGPLARSHLSNKAKLFGPAFDAAARHAVEQGHLEASERPGRADGSGPRTQVWSLRDPDQYARPGAPTEYARRPKIGWDEARAALSALFQNPPSLDPDELLSASRSVTDRLNQHDWEQFLAHAVPGVSVGGGWGRRAYGKEVASHLLKQAHAAGAHTTLPTEHTMFHGTYRGALDSILRFGLRRGDGTAGPGVYLAATPEDATYVRRPDARGVREFGGQPDTVIRARVRGPLFNAGAFGTEGGWGFYTSPLARFHQAGGPEAGYRGVHWKFGDGRSGAVVFDPDDVTVEHHEFVGDAPEDGTGGVVGRSTPASRYWLNAPPGGAQLNGRQYRAGQFVPGTTLFTHQQRDNRSVPPVNYDPTSYAPLPDPNLGAPVEQTDGTHALPVPQGSQQTIPGAPQTLGGEPFFGGNRGGSQNLAVGPPPNPYLPSERPPAGQDALPTNNMAAGAPAAVLPQHAGPPVNRTPGLPPDQAVLEVQSQQFAQTNYPLLRDAYFQQHAQMDPVSGDIRSLTLDDDSWRALLPGFTGTNGPALAHAARFLTDTLFREALTNQAGKGNNRVMVAAGADTGPESGMTNYLRTAEYPLVLDKSPTDYADLGRKFEEVRAAGMEPEYTYVDTPADHALGASVEAALRERLAGRPAKTVPLDVAARTNLAARRTALEVLFRNPEVPARVIASGAGKYQRRMITDRTEAANYLAHRLRDDERTLAGGALERLKQSIIARQRAGEIPADLVTAWLGSGWEIRPPHPLNSIRPRP